MTTSEVRTLSKGAGSKGAGPKGPGPTGLGPTGARPGAPGAGTPDGRPDGAPPVPAALTPATFSRAVATMTAVAVRPGVRVEPVRPPQRLAPWSHAVAADVPVGRNGETAATGRLVLLHDPDGHEAWNGTLRLVAFATAELDDAMSIDPMLPEVGWSWLTDALADREAAFTAAGGTITHTLSSRFGDLSGPANTASIELRASWTALDDDLGPHLQAFVDVLAAAAGLPPEGVAVLGSARRRS